MTSKDRISIWQQRLAKQRASGLSVTAWCKKQDICRRHFYSWRKRLAENSVPLPSTSPQWLAVDALPISPSSLTLRVGAVSIDVTADFDPQLLSAVIRAISDDRGKLLC